MGDLIWKRHKRPSVTNAHEIRTTPVSLVKSTSDTKAEATQPLNPRYRRPGRVRPARLWRRGRARRRGEAFEPFCAALFERRDLPAALATHSGTRAAALYQVAAEGGVGFQLQPRRRGAGLFIEPLALLEPSLLGVV